MSALRDNRFYREASYPRLYRVTYTMLGTEGWIDLRCREDARAFLDWGSETGAFIDASLIEVAADA